eukprot:jgi/Astpho2/8731/Aster-x1541
MLPSDTPRANKLDCSHELGFSVRLPADRQPSESSCRRRPTTTLPLVGAVVVAGALGAAVVTFGAAVQNSARQAITGRWQKSKEDSDDMTAACEAVQLSWVLRRALGLLNTLEVEDSQAFFRTVIKAGGVMDVAEKYPWNGEEVQHSRRDKRRGHHFGRVVRNEGGSPCIQVRWENPFGGTCADTFELSSDNSTLTQHTDMVIADTGQQVKYKTVYKKQR